MLWNSIYISVVIFLSIFIQIVDDYHYEWILPACIQIWTCFGFMIESRPADMWHVQLTIVFNFIIFLWFSMLWSMRMQTSRSYAIFDIYIGICGCPEWVPWLIQFHVWYDFWSLVIYIYVGCGEMWKWSDGHIAHQYIFENCICARFEGELLVLLLV